MNNQNKQTSQQQHAGVAPKEANPIGIRSVAAAAEMVKHNKPKYGKVQPERDMPAWLRDDK